MSEWPCWSPESYLEKLWPGMGGACSFGSSEANPQAGHVLRAQLHGWDCTDQPVIQIIQNSETSQTHRCRSSCYRDSVWELSMVSKNHSGHRPWFVPKANCAALCWPGGTVRLYGEFKATLNTQLCMDKYPVPHIEDLFASLAVS